MEDVPLCHTAKVIRDLLHVNVMKTLPCLDQVSYAYMNVMKHISDIIDTILPKEETLLMEDVVVCQTAKMTQDFLHENVIKNFHVLARRHTCTKVMGLF